MTNKLGVAISTWNRAKDFDRCLDLLFKQDYKQFDVYIVDNCSNDDTVEVIEKYIDLYKDQHNIEFEVMPHSDFSAIYTINMALRSLYNEYVVILDDDTFLEDVTALRRLVNTADMDENIAIVAANIRTHEDRVSLLLKTPKFDAVDYNDVNSNNIYDIDDFSGACALFRSKHVGPEFYDESFKLYWNEPEIAIRMVAKGHRVVVNQTIRIVHGSEVGRESCRTFYFGSRNTFRLMTKVLPVKQSLLFSCILIPIHMKRYYNMRHEKNFKNYLPRLIYAYVQSLYRCVFTKRLVFTDESVRRRVYDTYYKYFLKEILFGITY